MRQLSVTLISAAAPLVQHELELSRSDRPKHVREILLFTVVISSVFNDKIFSFPGITPTCKFVSMPSKMAARRPKADDVVHDLGLSE